MIEITSDCELVRVKALVTVNTTVKEVMPVPVKVWLGLASVEVVPSPKSHRYVKLPPLGSVEPAELKFTVSGDPPLMTLEEITC